MSLSKLQGGSSSPSATACAACKYQRKKCTKNCLLAPYFPQHDQKQFLNAHKLFGVSNITKIIKGLEECQRDTAMHNLIFHANARALDPVGGVYKIMCDLDGKIKYYQAQLNFLHQQVAMCRALAQQQMHGGCSYGDLLEQGEDCYDYQKVEHHQQSSLNYETFLEIPEQPSKVKREKEGIFDPEQNNLLSQIQII